MLIKKPNPTVVVIKIFDKNQLTLVYSLHQQFHARVSRVPFEIPYARVPCLPDFHFSSSFGSLTSSFRPFQLLDSQQWPYPNNLSLSTSNSTFHKTGWTFWDSFTNSVIEHIPKGSRVVTRSNANLSQPRSNPRALIPICHILSQNITRGPNSFYILFYLFNNIIQVI